MSEFFTENQEYLKCSIDSRVLDLDKKTALDYLAEKSCDMASIFMHENGIPCSFEINSIGISGAEKGIENLLKIGGLSVVHVKMKLASGINLSAYMSFPIYKTHVYFPSIVKINNKKMLLSANAIIDYIDGFSKSKPSMTNLYTDNDIRHSINREKSLFAIEDYEDIQPTRIL